METKKLVVDKNSEILTGNPQIETAALWIRKDEVVAFPTETVYGLGANACSDEAIDKIFKAKGRPSDNPLIVHIAEQSQLQELVVDIPEKAQKLIDSFWPGPLTIVLKSKGTVSRKVTAGLDTVAVRMPDHRIALALIKCSKVPLAAPSANLSGKPSPTKASHVMDDLQGRIAGVIDGGATGVGVESTVVDCTCEPPMILRPGGVTKEQLEGVIGPVQVDEALMKEESQPKSPGMKYTHYAPKAPLVIVDSSPTFLQTLVDKLVQEGNRVGVLTTEENVSLYHADVVIPCGYRSDLRTVAQALYDSLRAFDEANVDFIYSEAFPEKGVGEALMNRLKKAAGGQKIKGN